MLILPFLSLSLSCTGSTPDCDSTTLCNDSGEAGNALDLLLLIDSSPTMAEQSEALILNMDTLVDGLAGQAVQVHVTTLDLESQPAESLGSVALDDTNAVGELQALLACQAVCWIGSNVPSDSAYDPAAPLTAISLEWLDDTCGAGNWEDSCGGGREEGLEAFFEAACRGGGEVPEECFDSFSALTDTDADTTSGLWRDQNPRVGVLLTNEGDSSRRLETGATDTTPYTELYASFEVPLALAVIGPAWDGDSFTCNSGGTSSWEAERYRQVALATGLPYEPIDEEDKTGSSCVSRVPDAMEAIVDALKAR